MCVCVCVRVCVCNHGEQLARQHTSAYAAYISIRQRRSTCVCKNLEERHGEQLVRQHMSAYVSIRSIRQHTSAYLEERHGEELSLQDEFAPRVRRNVQLFHLDIISSSLRPHISIYLAFRTSSRRMHVRRNVQPFHSDV